MHQYADNSNLKGYEATDIVQFGDFYTFTKNKKYLYNIMLGGTKESYRPFLHNRPNRKGRRKKTIIPF